MLLMFELILLGYMGLLFILSSIPDVENANGILEGVPNIIQNMLHLPAYGILALLWLLTLKPYGITERLRVYISILLASGYSALMELLQIWVPGRYPSVWDLTLNVTGAISFILVYRILWTKSSRDV